MSINSVSQTVSKLFTNIIDQVTVGTLTGAVSGQAPIDFVLPTIALEVFRVPVASLAGKLFTIPVVAGSNSAPVSVLFDANFVSTSALNLDVSITTSTYDIDWFGDASVAQSPVCILMASPAALYPRIQVPDDDLPDVFITLPFANTTNTTDTNSTLFNSTACRSWNSTASLWNFDECQLVSVSPTSATCLCPRLTAVSLGLPPPLPIGTPGLIVLPQPQPQASNFAYIVIIVVILVTVAVTSAVAMFLTPNAVTGAKTMTDESCLCCTSCPAAALPLSQARYARAFPFYLLYFMIKSLKSKRVVFLIK